MAATTNMARWAFLNHYNLINHSFSAVSSIHIGLRVYAEQPQGAASGIEQGPQCAGHQVVHVAVICWFGSFEKGWLWVWEIY